ncbi:hypothetical protein C8R45DRAFT_950341 [Mycena sanguinolenta]|nr:hypothetical protein C8R45DRAFT_950341 [Mycena sanguinolenta]
MHYVRRSVARREVVGGVFISASACAGRGMEREASENESDRAADSLALSLALHSCLFSHFVLSRSLFALPFVCTHFSIRSRFARSFEEQKHESNKRANRGQGGLEATRRDALVVYADLATADPAAIRAVCAPLPASTRRRRWAPFLERLGHTADVAAVVNRKRVDEPDEL